VSGGARRLYRFSVEQYDRMARDGILNGEDRVELIDGLLVQKMTKNERHMAATKRIVRAIDRVLPEGYHVAKEDPIVTVGSEPEPDVAILRGDIDDYLSRKPRGGDVLLLVEVFDTTYAADLAKLPLYAEAGIVHCWIANIAADRIEAYAEPTGPDASPQYRRREDFARGATIPLVIDCREVARLAVNDLLPPELA
jgi:Uma2 family endonuclease